MEPQDGKIKVWTGSNANYQWVDVSTHSERYKFCADKSDHVYCNDDPGAMVSPLIATVVDAMREHGEIA